MKFTIAASKPRNPLVSTARARRAGSHRASVGGMRQQHAATLRREIEQLARRKDSP